MIEQIVRVLCRAGATPASAARAAVILDGDGSVAEAGRELVFTFERLDDDLLSAAAAAASACSCDSGIVGAHDIDCPVHGLAAEIAG